MMKDIKHYKGLIIVTTLTKFRMNTVSHVIKPMMSHINQESYVSYIIYNNVMFFVDLDDDPLLS